MLKFKLRSALFAAGVVAVIPALAAAQQMIYSVNAMEGLALRGYDAVAYQTDGEARLGDERFYVMVDNIAYRFATEANKLAFETDPQRYMPAYGGFCAYGAALGKKFDGDPNVWAVVDGRLFLNKNAQAQGLWKEDVPGHIGKADKAWMKIKDENPNDL